MEKLNLKIYKNILSAHEKWAVQTRSLCKEKSIALWNIIGGPGCGKTSLLEKLCPLLKPKVNCAVLEGDLQTTRDAERLIKAGVQSYQIITEGACHLGAEIVFKALSEVPLEKIKIVFIENVGNLVCPAEFDLGETGKIAVLSLAEGEDKPLKYPYLFRKAHLAILTKIDLADILEVKLEQYLQNLKMVNEKLRVFKISSRTGEGITELADYLLKESFIKLSD